MDWIERFLHISPDAGSGSLELSIVIGALIGLTMILVGVTKVVPTVHLWFNRARQHQSDMVTPKRMQ